MRAGSKKKGEERTELCGRGTHPSSTSLFVNILLSLRSLISGCILCLNMFVFVCQSVCVLSQSSGMGGPKGDTIGGL